jgi:hypothetical protein
MQNSRRIARREREVVFKPFNVIASAAKQSIAQQQERMDRSQ